MKILLDTHIFLWYLSGDARLSEPVRGVIQDINNDVFLSVVSIWEIVIKHRLGKINLPSEPSTYLIHQRQLHQIESLQLDEGSISKLTNLPDIHRDPFDRMLICQAQYHDMTIATVDATICRYPVDVLRTENV